MERSTSGSLGSLRELNRRRVINALSERGLASRAELARVTGLSRPQAGLGNRALVKEGFATMLAPGWYQLQGEVARS